MLVPLNGLPQLAASQVSSSLLAVLKWLTAPPETVFLDHAAGREFCGVPVLPALLCDCVCRTCVRKTTSSISAEWAV